MAQLPVTPETPSEWGGQGGGESGTGTDATKARRFVIPVDCTIDSIEHYVISTGTVNIKGVIWNNDGTVRGSITWPTVSVTSYAWYATTFGSPPSLPAGTYFFGYVSQGDTVSIPYIGAASEAIWEDGTTGYYTTPGNLTGSLEENVKFGIRVNYTPTSGDSPVVTPPDAALPLALTGQQFSMDLAITPPTMIRGT